MNQNKRKNYKESSNKFIEKKMGRRKEKKGRGMVGRKVWVKWGNNNRKKQSQQLR